MKRIAVVCLLAIALPLTASANEIISANYCSVANVANPPAGVYEAMIWNDLTSANGYGGFGSAGGLLDESGTPTQVSVQWSGASGISQNTNDDVNRPGDLDDGHDELMSGYLQSSRFGATGYEPMITLSVTGVDARSFGGSYDVLLYFDGDFDVEGDGVATFEVDDGVNNYVVYGQDTGGDYALANDGSDPHAEYVEIVSTDPNSPTAGNYVHFKGLTEQNFFVTITGTVDTQGVALNGFQITPEPASLLLVALGALLRRR